MDKQRDCIITLRASKAEKDRITDRAQSVGMSRSTYLRKMGTDGFVCAPLTEEERTWLATLGALRNDIKKFVNALHSLSHEQRLAIFKTTAFMLEWFAKADRALDYIDGFFSRIKAQRR